MSPLYSCSLCQNHQSFPAFVILYKHIRSIHRNDMLFNIRCTLNITCGSVYTTFESYRSNLSRYHRDLLNDCNLSILSTTSDNEQPSSLLLSDTTISQDEENEHIDEQEIDDEDELEMFQDTRSSENNTDWPLFTGLINEEDNVEEFTINSFAKHYTRFLLDLREGLLLPQSIIKSITSYFTKMISTLFKIIQNQAAQSPTGLLITLEDIMKLISQMQALMSDIAKNEHQFLKRCEDYFGYVAPIKIKLNDQDHYGYYIPMKQSIKNILTKPDVINYLVDNCNDNITQAKNDPDLMLTYRDGTAAQDNPSLKIHPNSFLIQFYTDGIGITNPIGPKKDEHKLTLFYFVLEDLPDLVRSMLQSIGLVGICPTKYLSLQTNQTKYFEAIIKDLNYLQTTGLAVQTFNGQLHFAFSVLAFLIKCLLFISITMHYSHSVD
ncbi:unnamed protein product [Rotaria magnacalcarata]|uniref:Uncharacterized protein n=1 Tax=Rotaria magnacalcarata TaxID=392030 RepID=A0A816VR75_9BILA|nr:unnamed protein product [Rotaria magnacalcarata]CAF4386766.1 unnamed protein product [Rotaria magnacalcarata]